VPLTGKCARGIVESQRFAGGPNPDGEAGPNITQKRLGDWSVKDIAYLLESGQTPDGDSVGSTMTGWSQYGQLSATIASHATYLKSLAPVEGPTGRRNSHALVRSCRRRRQAGLPRLCRAATPVH